MKKNCLKCKIEFNVKPSLERAKYCSRQCYWEDKKGKNCISEAGMKKLRELAIKQKLGGSRGFGKDNPFYGKKHTLESLNQMSISRTGKTAKENHPNWKGGITPEINKRVGSTEWKKLRKIVYERDDYQCQKCGTVASTVRIHAHHIIPFRISQSNELSNLTTLCERCHPKIERLKNAI
jgi:hypothetical protein